MVQQMSKDAVLPIIKSASPGVATMGVGALSAEVWIMIVGLIVTAIGITANVWVNFHFKKKHYELTEAQFKAYPPDLDKKPFD